MTKLIGFGRHLGKTTMAILESHATGKYILCANHTMARQTFILAKQMGYTIPHPLSASSFRGDLEKLVGRDESLIIDNVEMVLSALTNRPIETITFDSPNLQQADDRYIAEIAELKKELSICQKAKEEYMAVAESLREACKKQQKQLFHEWDKEKAAIKRKRINQRRFAR